jgi:hypothetical protein
MRRVDVPSLISTDKLLLPAVRQTIAALDVGEEYAAVARAAEVIASTIDAMTPEQRAATLGNMIPGLLRALDVLQKGTTPKAPRRSALQALRDARPA